MLFINFVIILTLSAMSFEILDVIRRKVSLLTLLVQTFVVNIFFRECTGDENYKLSVWIYFPILGVLCLLWEFLYVLKIFARCYSHKPFRDRAIFGVFSALMSLCIFCTSSYYVEGGRPFSCVFDYNKIVATILFYSNIMLLLIFSA